MSAPAGDTAQAAGPAAVIARFASLAALWFLLLPSLSPGDLATGALAVSAAGWCSLRLRPPGCGRIRVFAALRLAPYYLWESVRAGVDVALRAMGPRVRLQPGYFDCPLDLPSGLARCRFTSVTSLLPGTVACGEHNGMVVFHGLDLSEPLLEQLHAEERRLSTVLVAGAGHV